MKSPWEEVETYFLRVHDLKISTITNRLMSEPQGPDCLSPERFDRWFFDKVSTPVPELKAMNSHLKRCAHCAAASVLMMVDHYQRQLEWKKKTAKNK